MVVDGAGLVFYREITGSTGKLGSRCLLFGKVLGILIPDSFRESNGSVGTDGQDLRERKLSDQISQLIIQIIAATFL